MPEIWREKLTTMRAKLEIHDIHEYKNEQGEVSQQTLLMQAVGKSGAYDESGSDEDNTFAKFTPAANMSITIQNPALLDKFKVGDKFYVDFTAAE